MTSAVGAFCCWGPKVGVAEILGAHNFPDVWLVAVRLGVAR